MKRWFISDIHFNHFNVITEEYSNRPFLAKVEGDKIIAGDKDYPLDPLKPVDEQIRFYSLKWMNETIIENWNQKISPEDTVYFVGDFAFASPEKTQAIIKKLNGYKILIKGNHDRSLKRMKELGFSEAYNELTLNIKGEEVVLSHYPYVPAELSEAARKRPNIINYSTNDKLKILTIPENMTPEETKNWLVRFIKFPLNSKLPGALEFEKRLRRMIGIFIGTRLVNEGKILLHGHTHSETKRFGNMINLSVEAWNYGPASEAEISQLITESKEELAGKYLTELNVQDPVYKYYNNLANYVDLPELKTLNELIMTYANLKYSLDKNQKFETHHVPREYSPAWYELNVKLKGFIPKKDLVDGEFYQGDCRNASWAYWDGPTEEFYYIRTKFGSEFVESIKPLEKDDGFDLFIPQTIYPISPEEKEKFWRLKKN